MKKNGFLKANGTTLGADNGIGVAQILAVLDSDLPCNIEAVFTVSEETSMIGAIHFDSSQLKGRKLLNLDGFEENTVIIESACFYDIILKGKSYFKTSEKSNFYEVKLIGMPGGHSGTEIDKNRGNSVINLACFLSQLGSVELAQFVGGTKFNVIPSEAMAIFTSDKRIEELQEECEVFQLKLQGQYPNVIIKIEKCQENSNVINIEQTQKFLNAVLHFPHGIIEQNEKDEVTTSINLGVINLQEQEWKVGMRSSRTKQEKKCLEMLQAYCKEYQLEFTILGSQPGFQSEENSELIQTLLKTHPTKLFEGKMPKLKSMHITVEVGFFKEKIPDLEIAIISPNIQGAHTPEESVEIESVQKTDKWLWDFLKQYE